MKISGRTGTFTMNAECITMDYLAMVMGGDYDADNDKIIVTGDAPSRGFPFII